MGRYNFGCQVISNFRAPDLRIERLTQILVIYNYMNLRVFYGA
jgi:hypothetical protein